MTADRIPALVALALAGSIQLASVSASAAPPAAAAPPPQTPAPAAAQPPAPAAPVVIQVVMPGAPGAAGGATPGVDKPEPPPEVPSLASQLPIASYILTPISAAGGALIFTLLGGNAINDLKDPSKHKTPDETHSLVVKARAGQVVSSILFGFTGLTTTWGTISTIRAVMKMSKLVKPPSVTVGAAPTPGGLVVGAQGSF